MSDQPSIYEAMNAVMKDVGAIGKNRKADPKMGGYAFRGIDDLYNALHDKLATHGVFFVPEVLDTAESEYRTSGGATMRLVRVTVRYRFFGPAGDHVEAVTIGEAADTGDKAANKAMTAALKYLLFQVFCIATEDNEDADATAPELGARQTAPDATPLDKIKAIVGDATNALGWYTLDRYATAKLTMLTPEQQAELLVALQDDRDAVLAEGQRKAEEAAAA